MNHRVPLTATWAAGCQGEPSHYSTANSCTKHGGDVSQSPDGSVRMYRTSNCELRMMSGKRTVKCSRTNSYLSSGVRGLSLFCTTQAHPLGLKELKVAPRCDHLTLSKCGHTSSSEEAWGKEGDGTKQQHSGSFQSIVIFCFLHSRLGHACIYMYT